MKFGPITEMAKPGSELFPILIVAAGLLSGCERTSSKEESDQASLPHRSATTNVPASDSNSAMLKIPAGRFMMGEPSEADSPPHEVILSAFLLDKYLVTQDLFEKVMRENPSRWKGGNNPVEQVRWSDAVKFCNKRSELEGLEPCYDLKTWKCNFDATGYRLPTEAEFEYACRAGATTSYPCGDTPPKLGDFAWFEKNSGGHPRPVGQKQANAWGLYDMCGNLWEWCNDFYQVDYYASAPRQDPKGPDAGKTRVVRGGSWRATADNCRSGYRYNENPGYADVCFGYDIYGFRCARKP
jgi:formylglycine-generating enzyme required for sulfatase activity